MGEKDTIFESLGLKTSLAGASYGDRWFASGGDCIEVRSPTTGDLLAKVEQASEADYNAVVGHATKAFEFWRALPTPKRGEMVRQFAVALREKKDALGRLVSLEMGKILSEGLGEVQEMIDICDYAVGLSRTLSGPTLQSERPMHRMMEQWHPARADRRHYRLQFPGCSLVLEQCAGVCLWRSGCVEAFEQDTAVRHRLPEYYPRGLPCERCSATEFLVWS